MAALGLAAWSAGVALGYLGLTGLGPPTAWLVVLPAAACAVTAAGAWVLGVEAAGRRGLVAAFFLAALLLAGAGRGSLARHVAGPGTVDGYVGSRVALEGRVSNAGVMSVAGQRFRLDVSRLAPLGDRVISWRPVVGGVEVQGRGLDEVAEGDRVSIAGSITALPRTGPGGQDGYAERLIRQGTVAGFAASGLVVEAPASWSPAVLAGQVRRALREGVASAIPEPEATILLGVLGGLRAPLPTPVQDTLVNSGLVHVLAVSGLKVAIVVALLESAAVALAGRRGALAALGGIAGYCALAGAGASATRSAIMGTLSLVGRVVRRDTETLRSLLLAGSLMLTIQPSLVADLGFQYSFLGVLGIHLYAPGVGGLLRGFPGPLREAAAVTAAAQVATLPLTAVYFHVVPLLGPLSNALVLPLLPVAMVSVGVVAVLAHLGPTPVAPSVADGFLTALVHLPLALAGALSFAVAHWIATVARVASAVPLAAPRVWRVPGSVVASYYVALAVTTHGVHRRWRHVAVALAASAVVLGGLCLARLPDGRLHVDFIQAAGLAVLLRAPDGALAVIDGGPTPSQLAPALDAALPFGYPLPSLRRRLDLLVLTGGSREEVASGPALVGRFEFADVVVPRGTDAAAAADTAWTAAQRGARLVEAAPGDVLHWHDLELRFIDAALPGSLALELGYGDRRFLFSVAASARTAAELPGGAFDAVGLGAAGSAPSVADGTAGARFSPAAVVIQEAATHALPRSIRDAFGARTWNTAADGILRMDCTRTACTSPLS